MDLLEDQPPNLLQELPQEALLVSPHNARQPEGVLQQEPNEPQRGDLRVYVKDPFRPLQEVATTEPIIVCATTYPPIF